jgi:hypothetical protein
MPKVYSPVASSFRNVINHVKPIPPCIVWDSVQSHTVKKLYQITCDMNTIFFYIWLVRELSGMRDGTRS